MKRALLSFLLTLSSITIFAQQDDDTANPFYYSEVVQVEGVSKSELYQRALEWISRSFKGPKDVIQIQDKDAGNILCKGVMDIPLPAEDYVYFTFQIIVKDGRYKYILRDMYHEGTYNHGRTRNAGALADERPDCGRGHMAMYYWKKVKDRANSKAKVLVASAKSGMEQKSEIEDF